MYSLVLVTDENMADGFRLAGAQVYPVEGSEGVNNTIKRLIDDKNVGIIAVNKRFMEKIDKKIISVVERGTRPIIVPIPDILDMSAKESKSTYISSLVQRAIGFKIELKK